ncbi:hypothetical protein [Paractinoplanes maris]|uniref:hypothetical protein n=1 Tax=Paractinoplanes maris TaxID=1734446 RepID=UPI002021658C|nr:hypothetical protein [Actinoplanes maris]
MRGEVLAATVIASIALSGCGSPAKREGSRVATLVSTAPSSSPSKVSQRPRERLDTTPEEFEAMLEPYNKCMEDQGGYTKGGAAGSRPKPASKADSAKTEAANRICEPQFMPLPPWEKDPANPEARDFARDVVACLKKRGIRFVAVSDDGLSVALGGDQNDSRSITRGMELAPECEREVAARR